MAKYRLNESGVTDTERGASIPNSMDNADWREFQEWLAEGNIADPDLRDYLGIAKINKAHVIWREASQRTDVNKGKARSAEARHLNRLSKQARGQALSPADEALSATFEAELDAAELVYEAAEAAAEAVEEALDIAAVEAVVVIWPPSA